MLLPYSLVHGAACAPVMHCVCVYLICSHFLPAVFRSRLSFPSGVSGSMPTF